MSPHKLAVSMVALALAAAIVVPPPAGAMVGKGMHGARGGPEGPGACPLCAMRGAVGAACRADLETLGLPDQVRDRLEAERLELRKRVIRGRAELQIVRLELQRLVKDRGFDLAAAREKAATAAQIEAELQGAHLGFLHALASKLTDEQWQQLQGRETGMPTMGSTMGHGGPGHGADASPEAEAFFKGD